MQLDWRKCDVMGGSDEEYSAFDRAVKAHFERKKRYLQICEIGSYHGRSTVLLAQYGRVISIDLWGDVDAGTSRPDLIGTEFSAFVEAVQAEHLISRGRIIPIIGTSSVLGVIHDLFFDIVYIDADHHYEPSKWDITRSESHMAPDGLLICHDYKRPGDSPFVGVNRAVDELLERSEWRIREHVKGLVVLERT